MPVVHSHANDGSLDYAAPSAIAETVPLSTTPMIVTRCPSLDYEREFLVLPLALPPPEIYVTGDASADY